MTATTCAGGTDNHNENIGAIEALEDDSPANLYNNHSTPRKGVPDLYQEETPSLKFALTAMPPLRAMERSQQIGENTEPLPEQAQQQQHLPLFPKPQQQVIRSSSAAALELDWTCLNEGKLYGRNVEIDELQQAFYRRLDEEDDEELENPLDRSLKNNHNPELVLVSGKSGTGKSCLVIKALQQLTVEESDGHFIMGKFDQLQTPVPFGPFVAALTQLVIVLEQTHFQSLEAMRQRILQNVGVDGCRVLCCLVPALSRFLGLQEENNNINSNSALSAQQERLKVALHNFFRSICSSTEPLVLVLDDLQWADSGSLGLLETLVSESIRGLVVVGICRDNEVPWHHTFASMLRRLEDEKGARIVHIQVKNLSQEATNKLLSDMLRQPLNICQPLAQVIHDKSEGNVLFILQILKAMYAEKVLTAEKVDPSTSGHQQRCQWLLHEEQWQTSFENLDIIDLVSYQIKRLPESCQLLLKTAACIGAEFDSSTFANLLESDDDDIQENLAIALEEQMIVQQLHRPGKYAFLHDRIQQAGYALIPEEEQPMTHLSIGRALLQALDETEVQDNLFLVVNQLIRGMSLLTSEADVVGLAQLCLQAGHKASKASDYETARKYFCTGTELLSRSNRHWRDEYHLSLDLFNARAEAESACGDFDGMDASLDEAIVNCRSSKDELTFHLTRMCSLGSRSMFREAKDLGFRVMDSLGERFPSKPRLIYLIADLIKIKRRLRGKSDSDLLSLPPMDIANKSSLAVMDVLKLLSLYLFIADQDYWPFVVIRMVKLTLKHGICDSSAYSFSGYGLLLCALGEYDDAYRYGQIGQQIQDQSIQADLAARVNFIFHAAISPWKKPLRSCFVGHRATIDKAVELCDHECFVYSSYSLVMNKYLAGEQLGQLEDELNPYIEIIAHHRQNSWLSLAELLRKTLRNFQGKTDNPLDLGTSSNGTEVQDNCNKSDVELYQSTLHTHQLFLSYYLGDIKGALTAAKKLRAFERTCKSTYMAIQMYFYDGMASLEAANHGKKRHHMSQAKIYFKKIVHVSKHSEENVLHHVYLMRGEMHAVKGDLAGAMDWYKKAIENTSASQSFVQFEALAHERAGIAYERLGDEANSSEAKRYLRRAIELYEKWGAAAVVAHVKAKHSL